VLKWRQIYADLPKKKGNLETDDGKQAQDHNAEQDFSHLRTPPDRPERRPSPKCYEAIIAGQLEGFAKVAVHVPHPLATPCFVRRFRFQCLGGPPSGLAAHSLMRPSAPLFARWRDSIRSLAQEMLSCS
jgi:hypothetical protein